MVKDIGLLISRILIIFIFLHAGIDKIRNFAVTIKYMQNYDVPLTKIALVAAIIIEIVGPLLIILGIKSRYTALAMMIYLAVITVIFHNVLKDPGQMINLLKNIAILGGLLSIALNEPGRLSFDKQ